MCAEERGKAIKCLRELRNHLTDDVDLKLPIHNEKFLIRFVRGKKYDAELAHITVRKYYTLHQKNPKVFRNIFPSHELVKQIFEMNTVALLKNKDTLGRPVIVYNILETLPSKVVSKLLREISIVVPPLLSTFKSVIVMFTAEALWDPEKFDLDNTLSAIILIVEELLLTSLDAQLNGIVFIFDTDSCTLQHAKQYSIKRIKFIMDFYQGSFPMRLKGLHIVNEMAIVDVLVSTFRPFMNQKFKERMVMHGRNYENLHQTIPAAILPEQFGGTLKGDEAYDKEFMKTLATKDDYYQELLQYGFGHWDEEDEDTYL